MLGILKYKIYRESLIKIYFAFIRPVLEYGDEVWDNFTDEQSNLLESIQIEAARIITGLRRNSSKQYLYQELGWETLKKRRSNHKLILLFKILNNYTPEYLSNIVGECFPHIIPTIFVTIPSIALLLQEQHLTSIVLYHLQLYCGTIYLKIQKI